MIPVVLSGGSGTRLWPLSRELYPKQFLALDAGRPTLFQATLARLEGLAGLEAPIVVANAEHRFLAAEQLREAGIGDAVILLEPEGRNTAPALAAAALAAGERDPRTLILALPADHAIGDGASFRAAIETGVPAARDGRLVVFGIVPTAPETGYGYIRAENADNAGWSAVGEFVEKPDTERAASFLESGNYFWNSGIFLMRADRYLAELGRHAPDVLHAVRESYAALARDCDFLRLEATAFAQSPSISIDYAVMEHTEGAVTVPLDAGWSDVGSWHSLAEIHACDKAGNVAVGDALLEDTEGSYVRAESRLVATLGIKNQVIVETADAVLIADRERAQDVKRLVQRLADDGRGERLLHRRVHRPWGWYEGMVAGERYQVKHICVKPGASLSLQKHHHRSEHWVVVRGTAEVTRGKEKFLVSEDQSSYIPLGTTHRLHNPGSIPLELVEVQTGSYLGEDDIVRYDDNYGRSDEAHPPAPVARPPSSRRG
jgi:mannose-1-phosphate guanylyltransferase/mannose-6-phosphate isomerase